MNSNETIELFKQDVVEVLKYYGVFDTHAELTIKTNLNHTTWNDDIMDVLSTHGCMHEPIEFNIGNKIPNKIKQKPKRKTNPDLSKLYNTLQIHLNDMYY